MSLSYNNKEYVLAVQFSGSSSEELAQAIAEYRVDLLKPFKAISAYLYDSSEKLEGSEDELDFTLNVLATTESNINKALKEASGE